VKTRAFRLRQPGALAASGLACLVGRMESDPGQSLAIGRGDCPSSGGSTKEGKLRVLPVILPGGGRAEESELPGFLQGTTWGRVPPVT
jgi:hypothetical protein